MTLLIAMPTTSLSACGVMCCSGAVNSTPCGNWQGVELLRNTNDLLHVAWSITRRSSGHAGAAGVTRVAGLPDELPLLLSVLAVPDVGVWLCYSSLLQEGGVCIWDLRESVSLHASALSLSMKIASGIRPPSYSTDALSTGLDHHCCRIVRPLWLLVGVDVCIAVSYTGA